MYPFKNKKRYMIVLFRNKQVIKVFHNTMRKGDITDKWHELKTETPPVFPRLENNRGKDRIYELALIYPQDKRSKPTYNRDSLGRNFEVKIESKKHRVKEIIPYWMEETIYDYNTKKRLKYHQFIDLFTSVTEIAQIFKLNNKLVLQIDDTLRMFGNKNNKDCERLFDLLRSDLLEKKHGNFIYVKDVSTVQRMRLYKMLVEHGFNRKTLYRHYSY
jgi:hypothetical protein